MNNIEDRLRDAYRGIAVTVKPGSLHGLEERVVHGQAAGGVRSQLTGRRLLVPILAAAAVALVAVFAAVVIPRTLSGDRLTSGSHPGRGGTAGTGGPAGRFVVTVIGRSHAAPAGRSLSVRNAVTGTVLTTVRPPRGLSFVALATGDGRIYLASLMRPGQCRSWLYRFRLSDSGQAGRLTPARPGSVRAAFTQLAVSQDSTQIAAAGLRCGGGNLIATAGSAGGRLTWRQWTLPGTEEPASLSLTEHGRLLAYVADGAAVRGRGAYMLRTSAPPGPAARYSRLIAAASRFGPDASVIASMLSPDGRTLYSAATARQPGSRWELLATDVVTGRSRVIGRYPEIPTLLAGGPAVRRAIGVVMMPGSRTPTPSSSPVPSPAGPVPSGTIPVPAPSSASPVPSPGSPVPSPSRRPAPSPVPSPSRAGQAAAVAAAELLGGPARSATAKPSASPSPTPSPLPPVRYRVEMFNLTTGAVRVLHWPLQPGQVLLTFAW